METHREKIVARAGLVDVITNLALAVFKIVVGTVSNSIAIISDALHGVIDSVSGILILVSGKIAASKSIKNSAKKSARLEFATTTLIAGIIIIVGVVTLVESIHKIIEPESVDYSAPTIIILVASVLAKLFLGLYLKRRGEKIHSEVLKAGGVESLNDVMISGAVLVSALIYLIWHVDIEAYVSAVISFIIIKLGFELILPNLSSHRHLSHKN